MTKQLGRTFTASDQREQVAVISHDYFLANFAGDPAVIGKTPTLNKRPFTIIGVMPRGFQFPRAGSTVHALRSSRPRLSMSEYKRTELNRSPISYSSHSWRKAAFLRRSVWSVDIIA